eukprot:g15705.t1
MEYDMQHFSFPRAFPREYPKYSDHPDIPFWVSNAESARIGDSAPRAMPRTISEPTFKVTELPWGDEPTVSYENLADSAKALAAGKFSSKEMTLGSKTVKRWSTDMLERGQARNQPRLFDNIRPVRIGPRDLEQLDLTSSMEPIRNAALRRQAEERKRMASMPKRSRLYVDPHEEPTLRTITSQGTGGRGNSLLDSSDPGVSVQNRAERHPWSRTSRSGGPIPSRRPPDLRSSVVPIIESPKEPRTTHFSAVTFGTGTVARPLQASGIRCGGFQHLDSTLPRPSLHESRDSRARPEA